MSDYKEVIDRLKSCRGFEFDEDKKFLGDVATAIETLLAEREQAMEDLNLRGGCDVCKYDSLYHNADVIGPPCCFCYRGAGRSDEDAWEWRGIGGSDGT